MICVTCTEYYRQTEYNTTNECCNCVDQLDLLELDSFNLMDTEDQVEVQLLMNPSGHTKVQYDE